MTETTFSGLTLAICGCCVEHGPDPDLPAGGLTWQIVACPKCGAPCSCDGCVTEDGLQLP